MSGVVGQITQEVSVAPAVEHMAPPAMSEADQKKALTDIILADNPGLIDPMAIVMPDAFVGDAGKGGAKRRGALNDANAALTVAAREYSPPAPPLTAEQIEDNARQARSKAERDAQRAEDVAKLLAALGLQGLHDEVLAYANEMDIHPKVAVHRVTLRRDEEPFGRDEVFRSGIF